MTRASCFFLSLSLFLPSLATAQVSPALIEQRFHQFDKNGDNQLTPSEVPGRMFERLDTNGDKVVLLEEAQAAMGKPSAKARPGQALQTPLLKAFFAKNDANKDGSLSREEVADPLWFNKTDVDKDGLVSFDEAKSLVSELMNPEKEPEGFGEPVEAPQPIAQGPEILKPGEVGVGRQVPDVQFTDLEGKTHQLSQVAAKKGVVFAFTSSTCPVSKRYAPSLSRLEADLAEQGIPMVYVNPFGSEAAEKINAQIEETGFQSPYVHDVDKALTKALRAHTTTEVFLVDAKRTLQYRGALNDQYGISYSLDKPRHEYVKEALTALEEGRLPEIGATAAPGCELDWGAEEVVAATELTYHRDVERILQQNCVTCHHEGGIAPFSLDDYGEVTDRARVIKRVVEDGTMPPWFAKDAPGESPWLNDRSLSQQDKADLIAWLNDPAKTEGNPEDAPAPLSFNPDGWELGEPDHIIEMEPVKVKAEGTMPYVNRNIPTGLTEDKWLQAIEVQPGEREVVHHILVFLSDPDSPNKRIDELSGYFAVYVPGTSTMIYPDGVAKRVPAGTNLRFQMHYTPNGKAVTDQTRLGLHFADEEPTHEVQVVSVANPRIHIPAGAANHEEAAHRLVREDMTVLGFLPHMHTRGKAFKYEIVRPSGNVTLLDVPRYDFNWQLSYRLKEPLHLPIGTLMKVTAWYDNSAANPANPDPSVDVKWGQQTYEEMLIGYVEYMVPVRPDSMQTAAVEESAD